MEWISVGDELPEYDTEILCFDGIVRIGQIKNYCPGESDTWITGESWPIEVTHWMPLPAPPEK